MIRRPPPPNGREAWAWVSAAHAQRGAGAGFAPQAPQPAWAGPQRGAGARPALAAAAPPKSRRAAPPRPRVQPMIEPDGLFAFALFAPMLFIAQLGTLGALGLVAVTPLYLWTQRKRLWAIFAPRAFLFLVPAIALISFLWSQAPSDTMKAAAEYLITIIAGVSLAASRKPESSLRGMFLAFLLYAALSAAFGHVTAMGANGDEAFSGLSDSKNLVADITSTGLLVAMGLVFASLRSRSWGWALLACGAILVDVYVVVAARSAGAMMGLGVGMAALFGLAMVYRTPLAVRATVTGFLGICTLLAAVFHTWLNEQVMNLAGTLFDKDSTLTGRTYLWYRADQLIHQKPVLGVGYYAFWVQGNIDAEGLWRYAGITNRSGFTFHNTQVQAMVELGMVGFAAVVVTAAIGLFALIRRFVAKPNLIQCVWMAILLYELVRTPVEVIGLSPFYFSTVLTFAAMAFAFTPEPAPVVAMRRVSKAPQIPHTRYAVVTPLKRARRLYAAPASARRLLAGPAEG